MKRSLRSAYLLLCILVAGICSSANAVSVYLQQPTATFSQTYSGDFSIGRAINGTTADQLGWAVAPDGSTSISGQTAAFETVTDVGYSGGSVFTFTMQQLEPLGTFGAHELGRFRLSVTTDDRSTFADGLASGGDVTANWIVLDPDTYVSFNGATLTKLGDQSLLASGFTPGSDTYVITASTFLTGITGIRLEAMEDPSLPFNGPGRQPLNGNFNLSEFTVEISPIPEPSTGAMFILSSSLLLVRVFRKTNTPRI
jgi:hypothetical protein